MTIPTPIEVLVTPHGQKTKPYVQHSRLFPSAVATFAMDLIKLGAMHGEPDGETSTGHPKVRAIEPHRLVAQATEIAELTFSMFIDKGWIAVAPPYEEIIDDTSHVGFAGK